MPDSVNVIRSLQDELATVKEQLIDHQTSYLQMQTQHRQEIEEKTLGFNHSVSNHSLIVYKEFQNMMREHREQCSKDFKLQLEQAHREQEKRLNERAKEIAAKVEKDLNEKYEHRLSIFQENLIKHYESEFEDLEVKVRKIVGTMIRDEHSREMGSVKQSMERLEKNLRAQTEKYVQSYFMNQCEHFKEQIKSGVLQEHLIHKDLINSKLEKLFRASEEKRRKTQFLFTRHLSGLNFFVDNAHKQLSILKECHQDLLKNKEIADYYGDGGGSEKGAGTTTPGYEDRTMSNMPTASLYSMSLNSNNDLSQATRSMSKDNFFEMDDDQLIDESLLNDL
jgi:hypothetical protein